MLLSAQGCSATAVSRNPDRDFLRAYAPGVSAMDLSAFQKAADRGFRATDTLVYLASNSVPATFSSEPWREIGENVQPSIELFGRALKANPDLRIVYVSSGGTVYGSGHTQPISESAPTAPVSAYGYGKVVIEEALRFLHRSEGLSYAILRVSNPVGRWQVNRNQGIVSIAIRAARSGERVKLFDGGRTVRDFLAADDVADAILKASEARSMAAETWNIGSGKARSIASVVELVADVTGRTINTEIGPARAVDVPYAVLDCRKAQEDLGWRTTSTLEETIAAIERAWPETV